MNEHYDPSPSETWAEIRRYSWRAWLVFAAGVAVAATLLWRTVPEALVLAVFAGVFVIVGVRVTARVIWKALVMVVVAYVIIVALANKPGLTL